MLMNGQGTMPEERRNKIHNQRLPILQLDTNNKRGRSRGHRESKRKRQQNRVDEHEQKLGSKLAIKRHFGRSVTFF